MRLVTVSGDPQPSTEILARLHQIDAGFGLKWLRALKCWAVTMVWRAGDPRRENIRAGLVAEEDARDMFCQLPEDCTADQAYGYLVANLKAWTGTREDVRRLLDRAENFNRKREEENLQPAVDLATELVETNAPTLFREIGKTSLRHYTTDRRNLKR